MTTNDDERVQPTPDDWQKLCEIEVLTEDALQKALGPEHVSVSADEARLHLYYPLHAPSLSRWTARLGRVLLAV